MRPDDKGFHLDESYDGNRYIPAPENTMPLSLCSSVRRSLTDIYAALTIRK